MLYRHLRVEVVGAVTKVLIDRPVARNAVHGPCAAELRAAFTAFDADKSQHVAVLGGVGGHFCAGADLKAVAASAPGADGDGAGGDMLDVTRLGPMGPTGLQLSKPVIAAIDGFAVAGGLELALWCDMRVGGPRATFGVFCRRFGVPLIDGGTVRLPRLIGHSRAMDLILTGRSVAAEEALSIGLLNRLVPGDATDAAMALAAEIAALPQRCLRADRASALAQWHAPSLKAALAAELAGGVDVLASGESFEGAARFANGAGRKGSKL